MKTSTLLLAAVVLGAAYLLTRRQTTATAVATPTTVPVGTPAYGGYGFPGALPGANPATGWNTGQGQTAQGSQANVYSLLGEIVKGAAPIIRDQVNKPPGYGYEDGGGYDPYYGAAFGY